MKTPAISSIVITLNEENHVEGILQQLNNIDDIEIIVSDGGSTDRTVRIAMKYANQIVISEKGRGRQLNSGAKSATGDILLFLHADSLLPDNFPEIIRAALNDSSAVGGAFDLEVDSVRPVFRLISRVASIRSRVSRIPYGDQGIFVRREVYEKMNGFKDDLPLMEDVDFSLRLRKEGRISFLKERIKTSPRAWERNGIVKTTLRNWAFVTLFLIGYSPHKLYRRYYPNLDLDS